MIGNKGWWPKAGKRLDAGKAVGWDLLFFLICIGALIAAHVALEHAPLSDQDRDALLALHFRITYAALSLMGVKLLLHLLSLPDEEDRP